MYSRADRPSARATSIIYLHMHHIENKPDEVGQFSEPGPSGWPLRPTRAGPPGIYVLWPCRAALLERPPSTWPW